MKKLITILFILIFIKSNSQDTTIANPLFIKGTLSSTGVVTITRFIDTAKVIMLCADTSYKSGFDWYQVYRDNNNNEESIISVSHRLPECFWLFGYRLMNGVTLGPDKKRLSKNICVFLQFDAK